MKGKYGCQLKHVRKKGVTFCKHPIKEAIYISTHYTQPGQGAVQPSNGLTRFRVTLPNGREP